MVSILTDSVILNEVKNLWTQARNSYANVIRFFAKAQNDRDIMQFLYLQNLNSLSFCEGKDTDFSEEWRMKSEEFYGICWRIQIQELVSPPQFPQRVEEL